MLHVHLWIKESEVLKPVILSKQYDGKNVPEMMHRGVPQIWNTHCKSVLLKFEFEDAEKGKEFMDVAMKQRDWFC